MLGLAFVIGTIFGAVAHRQRFCTMGAIADWISSGDRERLSVWLFAIAIAMLGTQMLHAVALIDLTKSIYLSNQLNWLAHLFGGALFGFGMVFAGGCGSKNLLRLSSGNLKALVVLIVMGVVAFMTLKGILAYPRLWLNQLGSITLQDMPRLTDMASRLSHSATLGVICQGMAIALFAGAAWSSPGFRHWRPIASACVLGSCVIAAWYVSGHLGYLAEDPATLQEAFIATNSGKMEALSFVAPAAYLLDLLMMWSDASQHLTWGIAVMLGVVAGGFVSAWSGRQLRWEGFTTTADLADHLIGAVLMGFGGVTALGCSIGQGLSGIATLAPGSVITFFAIIAGAVAALRVQAWRIERE